METAVYIKEEPLDPYDDDDGAEKQEMVANQDAKGVATVKTELDDVNEDFEIVDEQPDMITLNAADLISDDERQFIANLHNCGNFLNKLPNNGADFEEYCTQCHRTFESSFEYKFHLSQWNCGAEEKILRCLVCPLTFSTAEQREAHVDLHRLNRFFCSQYCGLYFETVEQCEEHEYREHMLRNLSCSICHSRFRSLDALFTHQQHAHGKMQRYVCSHCRLWFSSSALLVAHWRAKAKTCGRLMENVVPHTYTSKEIVKQYKLKGSSPLTSSAPLAKLSLEICDADKRVKQEMDDSNDLIRVKEEPLDDYEELIDSFEDTTMHLMEPQLDIKVEEIEIKSEPQGCPSPETIVPETIAPIKTQPSDGFIMSAKSNFVNIRLLPSNSYKFTPMKVVKLPPNAKIIRLPIKTPTPLLKQSPAPVLKQSPAPLLKQSPAPVLVQSPAPLYQQTSPVNITLAELERRLKARNVVLNRLKNATTLVPPQLTSAPPRTSTISTTSTTSLPSTDMTDDVGDTITTGIMEIIESDEDLIRRKVLLSKSAIKDIEVIPEKQMLINNIKEKVAKAQKGEISIDTQLAELAEQNDTLMATKFLVETTDAPTDTKKSEDELPSLFLKLRDGIDAELMKMRRVHPGYRFFWLCPKCTRQYELKYTFRKHLLRMHNISLADSDNMLCEVFPQKISLNEAVQTFKTTPLMQPIQKHVCRRCGRSCSSQTMLYDHMRGNCSREPLYPCNVCNKKFYSAGTLSCHSTIHTGELPFSCNYCSKRFRTRGQVTVHHRTHTGERPFVCEVCHQGFTHRETLISHLSRHIGMKRYKCYGCNLHFSCISGLRTHRDIRPETCGKVKLNTRAVGPRVRVIRGNVMFEPQPQINPYLRTEDPQEVLAEIENRQNDANAVTLEEMCAHAAQ